MFDFLGWLLTRATSITGNLQGQRCVRYSVSMWELGRWEGRSLTTMGAVQYSG